MAAKLKIHGVVALGLHEELKLPIFLETAGGEPRQIDLIGARSICKSTQHRGGNVYCEVGENEIAALLDKLGGHRSAYDVQEEELGEARGEAQAGDLGFLDSALIAFMPAALVRVASETLQEDVSVAGKAADLALEWAKALASRRPKQEG